MEKILLIIKEQVVNKIKCIILILLSLVFASTCYAGSITSRSLFDVSDGVATLENNYDMQIDGDLTTQGTVFAAPAGYISDLSVAYISTTSVQYGPGVAHCKDKIFYNEGYVTDTISNFSNGGYTYGYIDYSESTGTNPVFIDSTTSPVYNSIYKGWYNGDDRCIAVYYCNGADTIGEFVGYTNRSTIEYSFLGYISIATSMNPDGTWQTPDEGESSTFLPVNAVKVNLRIRSADSGGIAAAGITTKELANGVNLPAETANYISSGQIAESTFNIPLGQSRDVRIRAADDDDNGSLNSNIRGFTIRR